MKLLTRWRHRRAIRRGRKALNRRLSLAMIFWDSSDDATHQIKSPEAVAYVASLPSNKEHNHAT